MISLDDYYDLSIILISTHSVLLKCKQGQNPEAIRKSSRIIINLLLEL